MVVVKINRFGTQHILDMGYVLGTFDRADAETGLSHHPGVEQMLWTVVGVYTLE